VSEIDLALLERLVRSYTWREYREQLLLPAYGRVSQALDVAATDHRYLQGLKEGLRLAMMEPYRLLGLPAPLEQGPGAGRLKKRVPPETDAPTSEAPALGVRPSYLA